MIDPETRTILDSFAFGDPFGTILAADPAVGRVFFLMGRDGAPRTLRLSASVPTGIPGTGRYVIAVVDAANGVAEMDETNNVVAFGPIR